MRYPAVILLMSALVTSVTFAQTEEEIPPDPVDGFTTDEEIPSDPVDGFTTEEEIPTDPVGGFVPVPEEETPPDTIDTS
ncbi:MAG: hypothetical protein KAT47_03620, partial [Candidatus Aegiribacteria sp.]|nr:hypothetical protein [Candidatus Aegiribacteria sp.]